MCRLSSLEDLPNELLLQIFSYLNQLQIFQCFLDLNQRWTDLLVRHMSTLRLSMNDDTHRLLEEYLPSIKDFVRSLSIDHQLIDNAFLQHWKFHPLINLCSLELIDHGIDLAEELLRVCQPERLKIVQTPFCQARRVQRSFLPTSLRRLQIDAHVEPACENCCFDQLDLSFSSLVVDVRLSFSQLSSYIRFSSCLSTMPIEKFSLSIISIDDHSSRSHLVLPELTDFQLEVSSISLDLFESLLPLNDKTRLKRLAFIGRLTNIDARQWRRFLSPFSSLKRWDLQLFDPSSIDWDDEFPQCYFEWNPSTHIFRRCSSTFDRFSRLCVNECLEDLTHLARPDSISHLILRSQYWCSYFPLSSSIEQVLISRFHSIRRLSISSRQLRVFYRTNFLDQIERMDLEFAEQFCQIDSDVQGEFPRLKSVYLSSIYEGVHQLNLHSTLREILREKFVQVNFLSIDSIKILDDEQLRETIDDWFPSSPRLVYIPGQAFSIWFSSTNQ